MIHLAGKLAWWLIMAISIFILGSVFDTLIDPGFAGPAVAFNALKSLPK